jgi:AcrR family transcriptional regulator
VPGMAAERRTRLAPEDRSAQLVALGVASLVERPLHSLSIEWLSAEAGVSRGLLFHYFGSKQGLHREVVRVARDSMLRATEPAPDLEPLERLHDTLTRIVLFVREHRGTFYSLVRGVASGDLEVREVVEQARIEQADRVIAVFLELGMRDTVLLRVALRSWVAFAEEALAENALQDADLDDELPADELVGFLERSAVAVASAVDPAWAH